MNNIACASAALACLVFQVGCASITSGKEQSMSFATEPAGADCTLSQQNMNMARFKTPNTMNVRRANTPIMMTCSKPGYYQARVLITNTTSVGAWGNLVVGGLIGVMVDQSSGAAFAYYDPPKINLVASSEPAPQSSQTIAQGVTLLPPGEDPIPVVVVPANAPTPASSTSSSTAVTNTPAPNGQTTPPNTVAPSDSPTNGQWNSRFRL